MTDVEPSEIYSFNKQAMESLKRGKVLTSEKFLLRAQSLLKSQNKSSESSRLWAITCNNLACVYKSTGDTQKALKNLFLALETEEKLIKNPINIAGIYLNISSIYSQMNLHKISLKYAMKAQKILHETPNETEIYWVSLVTSYYAAGKEYEFLVQIENALKNFTTGLEASKKNLGEMSIHTLKLKKCLNLQVNTNRTLSTFVSRNLTPTRLIKKSPTGSNVSPSNEKALPLINTPKIRAKNSFLSVKKNRPTKFSEDSEKTPSKYPRYFKTPYQVIENLHKIPFSTQNQEIENLNKYPPFQNQEIKNINKSIPIQSQESKLELVQDEASSLISSASEDKETKKMCESSDPHEVANKDKKIETLEKSVECEIIKVKSMKDENIQTKLMRNDSEASHKFSKFKRIAAIIIQKFWRSYKTKLIIDKKQFSNVEIPIKEKATVLSVEASINESLPIGITESLRESIQESDHRPIFKLFHEHNPDHIHISNPMLPITESPKTHIPITNSMLPIPESLQSHKLDSNQIPIPRKSKLVFNCNIINFNK